MRQISIGQCVSVKYFHDKGVAWSQTKPSIPESTQMRIHTAAQSVIRHWPHQELCRPTIRSLRMTNHSTAQCVIRNSVKWVFCTNAHKKLIWFHMKELSEHWEQLNGLLPVWTHLTEFLWTDSMHDQIIFSCLRISCILCRKFNAYKYAPTNAHKTLIWFDMKEFTLIKNHLLSSLKWKYRYSEKNLTKNPSGTQSYLRYYWW